MNELNKLYGSLTHEKSKSEKYRSREIEKFVDINTRNYGNTT